jgi:FHS family L-fucose permease-like MFS transporter
MAVIAQFLYVAAQAGIFSFFINYMTSQVPEIPPSLDASVQHSPDFFKHWMNSLTEIRTTGAVAFNNKGASNLVSVGLLLFLGGRFIGTGLLRKFAADKLLGLYGAINTVLCLLIFFKLGWLSAVCVFGTYFFMSIMFPTIFALGIFGLGQRAKRASSFLVMAIMGGAILPKVMGAIADMSDLSRAFIVPMVCFGFIAVYAYLWPRLSGSEEGMRGVSATGGH